MVRNTSWTQMAVRDPLGDALTKFDAAFKSGQEAKQEKDAPEAFGKYLDSLDLQGQAPTAGVPTPGSGAATTGLIGGSHAAAEAAQDPLLTAFFQNARQAESGGDDAAKNPNSTATGRYQFLESTWADLGQRHPELGLTPDGRTDPAQQERAMRVFTQENARQLGSAGIKPGPGSLYAAHFLGAGGASKVLGGDPNSPVSAYVSPETIAANPQLANMTVGQFTQWANEKGGNSAGGYAPPASEQPQQIAQQQPQGSNGLPPREVMLELFRNPNTRPLAIELAKSAKEGRKAEPIEINGQLVDPSTGKVLGDYRTPEGEAEGVNFDDISGLRKEVQGLPSYKNLAQATPIYASMTETAGRDSRASDLNLVYGLGKIMDPTSVVREGEMFMVQGINTLPDKVVEGVNSLLTGTSTLSETTRKAILQEAFGRVKGYEDAFNTDATSYRDIAGRYKINPDDVLPKFPQAQEWMPRPSKTINGVKYFRDANGDWYEE